MALYASPAQQHHYHWCPRAAAALSSHDFRKAASRTVSSSSSSAGAWRRQLKRGLGLGLTLPFKPSPLLPLATQTTSLYCLASWKPQHHPVSSSSSSSSNPLFFLFRLQSAGLSDNFCNTLKKCAIYAAVAASIFLAQPYQPNGLSHATGISQPVVSDLAVLISGPPIKDPNALLRYALPIQNKPIRDMQKALEEITEDLKLPGIKAIDPVGRNVRQVARVLSQSKREILADVGEAKKGEAEELLNNLAVGLQDFEKIIEEKDRTAIAPKQKELLYIIGDLEEAMVEKFPFDIPEEFSSRPLLKGRATVEMKVNIKDNPNLDNVTFQMVLDGYNAPVTAGNFTDLVERHFYDGMDIQRADGFVVQTGDPDGPAEGFVDPSTGKIRTVPLEIMVDGDKQPIYSATLEELGRFRDRTRLPFNAFGTLAMAREEFDNDSASSQIFWLLKESELTPSSANILDGRYAVFGYVTENQDYLADLKVGDTIESMKVIRGIDNLANPSYKVL